MQEQTAPQNAPSPAARTAAWAVHAFTASGVVLAMLALVAVERGQWTAALAWLGVALIVDGVDGSFARAARVKERAVRIDGDALDLIIDYLTYVFIPALFIWRAGLVPPALGPWLAAAILVSALYCFARKDMKTSDNYFRGFPALWNVVALYLHVAGITPAYGAVVVATLAILTFAPVHFVHPFRVRDYGAWLPALACLWAAATAGLLWPGWGGPVREGLFWASSASALILVALGLVRTVRGPRRFPAEAKAG